jgi:hypothetical protein
MSFINWGSESPEQKEIRRRMEEQMMFEQMSYSAAVAAAAAAGSGSLPRTKQGQTSSYTYESETGQFYIGIMDFEKGSLPAVFNTGLNTSENWYYDENNYDGTYVVQDRGYLMTFSNNSSADRVFFFFSAGGALIQKLEITTQDTSIYSANGNFIVVCDWDAYKIWWFDGLEVRTEDIPETAIDWDYSDDNLSGFFITTYTAEGVGPGAPVFYNVFFTDESGLKLIRKIEVDQFENYYLEVYENSNIFRLAVYNGDDNEWKHIYYYDNTGVELASLDLSAGNYTGKFADVFGAGKHVDTFYNNTEYFICYYDELAGDLLTTIHDRVDHPNFIVRGQYRNNGSQYNNITENGLITFSNNLGYNKNLYNVTYCDFIRLQDGMEDLETIYTFADDEPKAINWDRIHVADSIFLPVCPDTDAVLPQLAYLTFTSSGTITSTPLISFDDYDEFTTRGLGNRYLIDAYRYDTNSPGTYFITTKTGSGFLEYTYDIRNSNYRDHEGDVVAWRNSNDTDFQSYYLPINDPAPFEAITLPPFGRIKTTSTYRQEDKLYPGNLLIQSGEGRRLYLFNDIGADTISDGGDDMYDTGNRLNTNLTVEIAYTHTQMVETPDDDIEALPSMFEMDGEVVDGTTQFGAGSEYFTNLYPGLFTMVAKGVDITEFFINGNTGIDSHGYNTLDSYQVTVGGNEYTAFLKTTTGGGSDFDGESDPTINQIIIVNAQDAALIQEINENVNTNNDYHKILGLDTAGVTEVHYLLMSTYNKSVQHGFTETDFTNVVDRYLDTVDGLSISATLTALNEDYSLITNQIADTESYTLTLIKADGSIIEKDSVFYNEGLDLGPTMCACAYTNSDGFACVDVYDIDLELISTYVSTETNVNTVRIIDNRLYIITSDFDEDAPEGADERTVMAIMRGTSFIKKEYINNIDWRTSNDYAAWYN